jgi:3D (Asp-Asp-Asp) domain-containing protein
MGTRLYVPGYGLGRVEDIGGAIKGDHIDLWFPTHQEARAWGVRRLTVRVIKE